MVLSKRLKNPKALHYFMKAIKKRVDKEDLKLLRPIVSNKVLEMDLDGLKLTGLRVSGVDLLISTE